MKQCYYITRKGRRCTSRTKNKLCYYHAHHHEWRKYTKKKIDNRIIIENNVILIC